jgi:2-amino-4-hydroxy-6-hydroxymethyldihydropteridine diphosphokinase
MEDVYLLLGSNVGNRGGNLTRALEQISLKAGGVTLKSNLYETEPWGMKEQQSFLNQAVMIQSNLEAVELLTVLKGIEKEVGRQEGEKWGPRIIDIDILFYGNHIIDTLQLKVPHPYIQERRFALAPLFEIAPAFIHPVFGKSVGEMLEECGDGSRVFFYESEG